MPSKVVLDAVRDRQQANWTTTPVYYPNEVTVPPEGLAAFVTTEFPIGDTVFLTLKQTQLREDGTIRFLIHMRLKTGSDLALEYADEIAALFRGVRLIDDLDMTLDTLSPGPAAGLGADGAYSLTSVVVPYLLLFKS